MPDIFISYSRTDRDRARVIADSLVAEGFDVWWDANLKAGEAYDEVTEDNLRSAGTVVVLWSKTSCKSKWVRAEATIGERHSVIVPALIEPCERPLRFELVQTADLMNWHGDRDHPDWRGFVTDINDALITARAMRANKQADPGFDTVDALAAHKPAAAKDDDSIEAVFWSSIKDTADPAELEAYLRRYRDGHFVDLANARLIALNSSNRSRLDADESLTKKKKLISPVTADEDTAHQGVPQTLIAIAIFAVATVLGVTLFFTANAINLGWFTWTPSAGAEFLTTGRKEIGFYTALNWSLTALFLMPIAWTLIYLALAQSRATWQEMVRRRMLVTTNFTPINSNHPGFIQMQRHIRLFVIGGMVIVTSLAIGLSLSDYHQVAGATYGNATEAARMDSLAPGGYPIDHRNLERDWSIVTFLSSDTNATVSPAANNAFSLTAYLLYAGLGIGSFLSFGLVFMGLGATFMRGFAQNYGLMVIPDLNSADQRCGFEVVRPFFLYGFMVALIACVICYLMAIQNIYLRTPDPTIFAFLTPDLAAFNASTNWGDKLDALVGFLFAPSVPNSAPQNVYAWFFCFFIVAIFIGSFMQFLNHGAAHGKAALLKGLDAETAAHLHTNSKLDIESIKARIATIKVWPLDHPSLKHTLMIVVLLLASFVFYKIGVLIVIGLCIILPAALFEKHHDENPQ